MQTKNKPQTTPVTVPPQSGKKRISTRTLVAIGLGAAIAFVLQLFEFVIPFVPPFVKFDFSDLPAMILSFSLGPAAGILIELLKNILHIILKGTTSAGVGELSNFILGAVFVGTAGLIYRQNRTRKGAVIGMVCGSIAFALMGILSNLFVMFPFYTHVMGMPLDAIIAMGTKISPYLDSSFKIIVLSVTPFNIVKGLLVSLVTLLLYKRLQPIIRGHKE